MLIYIGHTKSPTFFRGLCMRIQEEDKQDSFYIVFSLVLFIMKLHGCNLTRRGIVLILTSLTLVLLTIANNNTATMVETAIAQGAASKVAICHVPPGNPANAHTIVVGEEAVQAHLAHGDTGGTCPASEQGGPLPPVTITPTPDAVSPSPPPSTSIPTDSSPMDAQPLEPQSSLSPPPSSPPASFSLTLTECSPGSNGDSGISGRELLTCTVSGNRDISEIVCNMEQQQNPLSRSTPIPASETTALCGTINTTSSNDGTSPPLLLSLQCVIPAVQPGVSSCHPRH
jgi:hypothetical protein